MGETVLVTIPVSVRAAKRLEEPGKLEQVGELVSRLVAPDGEDDPLIRVMTEIGEKARAAGLTDEDVDAELAAYNAERRA